MSTIINKPDITQNIIKDVDSVSPLQSDKVTKRYILEMMYLLSHLAFASILIVFLKNINPLALAVILFMMLGYISYDEQQIMPMYTLPLIGTAIYIFDLFIVGEPKNTIRQSSVIFTLKTTLWKLPYYGIISYYVILYASNLLKLQEFMKLKH